jgi:PAS domain S-box-containing protein
MLLVMKAKPDHNIFNIIEKSYKTFFENCLDAIMITSQDGSIYAANQAACKMLGRTEEEIRQLGRDGIVEKSPPQTEAVTDRKIRGKFFGESTYIRKDGTKFPVEISSSVFKHYDGREFTAIIARDIYEHKRSEDALRESEARYRSLFDNSPIGISTTDKNGNLLQANHAYAKMYGYESPEEMFAEVNNVKDLYSNPDERKRILAILHKKKKLEPTEVEVIRRDGSKFSVLVSVIEVCSADGTFLYHQANHLDLTDRMKTEEKIRTASLYARSLIEASLDPLVTINSDGKITDVNLATEKITGIKRDKLIGSEFADYFVETDKAREGYNIVFSKGMVKDYPLTIRHKSGRTADVLYNATIFKNEEGLVQGVFATARDVTVRKRMEVKLRDSRKLLQNLNQHLHEVRENERSQIAMNLHDDLGQRLTALFLDVSWIKSRIGVQSIKVRTRLEEMTREINDAIEGIKELSSFLRPTILYDLGLVPAIISQLNKFESQSGIKCYFYFDSEEFNVSEKISLIFYRIIQESLTNIARHSGASAMELSLRKLKKAIEMRIKDDGVGIDENKIDSLTSMGLAGIRERVESAHGEITIIGEKGSGTTITVTIPLNKNLL